MDRGNEVMRGPVEKFARAVCSEKITCALFMKVQRQSRVSSTAKGPAREGRPVLGFRVLGIPFVLEREQMLSAQFQGAPQFCFVSRATFVTKS